jgi:ribosomal protein L40E
MKEQNINKCVYSDAISYCAVRALLQRAAKRAEIKKRVNPHIFRHARASLLGRSRLGEAIMQEVMGWEKGSKMTKIYVHLSGEDCDKALLENVYGIRYEEEPKKKTIVRILTCAYCGSKNPSTSNRCNKCFNPTGQLKKSDIEENRAMVDMSKTINVLMNKDDSFKRKLIEQLKLEIMKEIQNGKGQ